MNDNIDLTELLEGCSKGTEFYSTLFGKVTFDEISYSRIIICYGKHKCKSNKR